MSESNTTSIGAVASCFTGYPFDSKSFLGPSSGDARVFRGDNLKEGYSEWGEKERRWAHITTDLERFQLREGDILVGMDGSKVGKNWTKVICGDLPALLGQRVCRIRADENADQNFLYHVFGSTAFRSYVERVKTGTSIPHISNEQIKDFCLPIPPLPEQKKIAEILSGIDNQISLLQRKLEKIRTAKSSVLKQLTSQPNKDEGHHAWKEVTIEEICEIHDSKRIPLSSEQRRDRKGEFPYYGANNIQDYIDDYIFDFDAVLLAEDGGYYEQYSTRGIAQYATGKYWVNNHAHILTGKGGVSTKFIYYSLVHKNICPWINTGTRSKLNQSDLKQIAILLPPCELQAKAVSTLEGFDLTIQQNISKLGKLYLIKNSLASDLLSGRKRVSV